MTRTAKGTFAKGNAGGPGRPARHVEITYLAALYEACPLDAWREIIERAVDDAKNGDEKARQWLTGYLIGKASEPAALFTRADKSRANDEKYSFLD